jgi:adenine-specific DNA glycosylase
MNDGPHFKTLKLQEDMLRFDDGCGAVLPFRNSQNPSGVLMSESFEPH